MAARCSTRRCRPTERRLHAGGRGERRARMMSRQPGPGPADGRVARRMGSVRWNSWLATSLLYCGLISGAALSVQVYRYGSIDVAVASMRGESIVVRAISKTETRDARGRPKLEFSLAVRNLSGRPVRLVGGTATCTCAAIGSLPLEIPALGERAVIVTLSSGIDGAFPKAQRVMLFTDNSDMPNVVCEVRSSN